MSINDIPARVSRAVAKRLLCVGSDAQFKKIVDAYPRMKHRLPGETRWHYLREEIRVLLSSRPTVCDLRGRKSKS